MQIAVQEREVGELVDGLFDDPGGAPEIEVGGEAAAQQGVGHLRQGRQPGGVAAGPPAGDLEQLHQRVQVAQEQREPHRQQADSDGALPAPPHAAPEVESEGVDGPRRQREHRRQPQVVGHFGGDAQQPRRAGGEELSEVVVIDVAASPPGVVGREVVGAQHGVQVCEVHRLLAAEGGVPEVGVGHADRQQKQERAQEHRLADGQRGPGAPDRPPEPPPGEQADRQPEHHQPHKPAQQRPTAEGRPAQAG